MEKVNDIIKQQAAGGVKINPDEQRTFLTTFKERVIGLCSIEEADSPELAKYFSDILKGSMQNYTPVLVKISPFINSKQQIVYLKIAQELDCEATIVSENCTPKFGLVLHTNHPTQVEELELTKQYPQFFSSQRPQKKKSSSFWKSLFG